MINLFRRYTPVNLIYLIPIALLLCIGAFINVPIDLRPVFFAPALSNLIGNVYEKSITPESSILITLSLTILQGILLNHIISKYNLLGKVNYLTALIFVTLASIITPFLTLSSALLCNFLLIWMIDKLLSVYRAGEIMAVLFDMGLIIAVGSLFYFPFIAMFPVIWFALIIFRSFNLREWIVGVMGFITIYFLLFIIYLWFDMLDAFKMIWHPLTRTFPTSLNIDLYDYWVLLAPLFILILFIISIRQNFFKSLVFIRKAFQLLFFMLLLATVSFYLNSNLEEYHFLLCVAPLAIYMAYYFTHAKTRWLYESAFALLFLAILYFQWI
ncbi:DUF6427 family protein [Albibacterium profundi]|uniref:DUF6427 family protein n=1 Tax=Albibacterium profundi TaxID=3134906 RepID=A0ABV5CCK7_9SPHI